MEFWRLSDWGKSRGAAPRVRSAMETGVTPDEILPAMPPTVLVFVAVLPGMLRMLVLEEERWW